MARQSTTPMPFQRSTRTDIGELMSSGRAGVVTPVAYIPLLRGDTASGRIDVNAELAEMPRPLINGAAINFQAWFVPKACDPRFEGTDELMASYFGDDIKTLGKADRTPAQWFNTVAPLNLAMLKSSTFFTTLGIHIPNGVQTVQTDVIDAFNLVYNFRLAAHSSRLALRKYAVEDLEEAVSLPPAFWPSSRFSGVVPDYERALIVGDVDMDVSAGRAELRNIYKVNQAFSGTPTNDRVNIADDLVGTSLLRPLGMINSVQDEDAPFVDFAGAVMGMSLASLDKARTTQAFAKAAAAYAGNDATGFENHDTIMATLLSGFTVPEDAFKRPWLLDSMRVPVQFGERFATDGASLDQSVVQGRCSGSLSLNVPLSNEGGTIIVTMELLPDRIYEAQSDEWLTYRTPSELPDALRDIQRVEPVDFVKNSRIDARHGQPNGLYGYEPMNNVWNRNSTRLGGVYYQANAGIDFSDQRSGVWQTTILDPEFTKDHFLAPEDFPHNVFSDREAPAFEFTAVHSVAINGLTQIGDVLTENNDDYEKVVNTRADSEWS